LKNSAVTQVTFTGAALTMLSLLAIAAPMILPSWGIFLLLTGCLVSFFPHYACWRLTKKLWLRLLLSPALSVAAIGINTILAVSVVELLSGGGELELAKSLLLSGVVYPMLPIILISLIGSFSFRKHGLCH
jgi:hypothetical protein